MRLDDLTFANIFKNDDVYEGSVKKLRFLRNDFAHRKLCSLPEKEFNEEFRNVIKEIEEFKIFKDLERNLDLVTDFLRQNKTQSFPSFCKNHPQEIEKFFEALDDQDLELINNSCIAALLKGITLDNIQFIDLIEQILTNFNENLRLKNVIKLIISMKKTFAFKIYDKS